MPVRAEFKVGFGADITGEARLYSGYSGVLGMVEEWVNQRPSNYAVCDSATGTTLTYAELWRRAGWMAATLVHHGVGHGSIVAVDLDRSADLVVALLGIVRAGAAYLPLDDHAPPERLATILDEAEVSGVVRADLAASRTRPAARLPEHVRQLHVPRNPPRVAGIGPAPIGPDDAVYVAYTSGSTGRPKGVVVPHRAVLRLVSAPLFCALTVGERVAHASNPTFDATTFEIWNTLTSGATVVVFPSVKDLTVQRWARLVAAERVQTMFLTTSLFHMVAKERPDAFADLRTVVVGGEQMDLVATRRVLAAGGPRRLVNGYGPTETTTFAAYYDCTTDSLARLDMVPIGFPLQQTRLHVLDERLGPVPSGQPGELCVGGPGVALGYLRRPDLTSQRFVPEPGQSPDSLMYRTGDVVRRLDSGALVVLGRLDRQVKLRGFRIELEEIERAVLATGLASTAFVEKVGDGATASLVGFVLPADVAARPEPGTTSSASGTASPTQPVSVDLPATLTERLAARLPKYMVPTRWVVLSELPIGPTGKVDRAALLRSIRGGLGSEEAFPFQPDRLADQVAGLWTAILGGNRVSAEANFVEAGGNSILAMQLASRINEQLAVPVEPADILLAGSFRELVSHIRPLVGRHRNADATSVSRS